MRAPTLGAVRGLFVHAVVFVAVNGVLIGVWVLLNGSTADLGDIVADPASALDLGFWPILVILPWTAALTIHGGIAVAGALSPSARRERREAKRREQHRRKVERQVERGRAKGEELLTKTANAAIEGAFSAVDSLRAKVEPHHDEPARVTAETRWVAVMFTDIANSTGLAESMGDEAWNDVLARHRRLVRQCVDKHGGQEIGTQGDGFLVRHDSPADAVATAIAIQRSHDRQRRGRRFLPEVRIGIHAGDTLHDEDGDLVGQVVNLAARVMGEAEPGQILVTEPVADRLGPEVTLEDCGLHELRGVSRPRHLLAVAH